MWWYVFSRFCAVENVIYHQICGQNVYHIWTTNVWESISNIFLFDENFFKLIIISKTSVFLLIGYNINFLTVRKIN